MLMPKLVCAAAIVLASTHQPDDPKIMDLLPKDEQKLVREAATHFMRDADGELWDCQVRDRRDELKKNERAKPDDLRAYSVKLNRFGMDEYEEERWQRGKRPTFGSIDEARPPLFMSRTRLVHTEKSAADRAAEVDVRKFGTAIMKRRTKDGPALVKVTSDWPGMYLVTGARGTLLDLPDGTIIPRAFYVRQTTQSSSIEDDDGAMRSVPVVEFLETRPEGLQPVTAAELAEAVSGGSAQLSKVFYVKTDATMMGTGEDRVEIATFEWKRLEIPLHFRKQK